MGDKALALGRYVLSGLVLYPPYIPIGHDVCNTYKFSLCILGLYFPIAFRYNLLLCIVFTLGIGKLCMITFILCYASNVQCFYGYAGQKVSIMLTIYYAQAHGI